MIFLEYIAQVQKLLNEATCFEFEIADVIELQSAQQKVLLLKLNRNKRDQSVFLSISEFGMSLRRAIVDGDGHLILRIWKGSARWWNLNSKTDYSCLELAKSEVLCYDMARFMMDGRAHSTETSIKIRFPKVIYFQSSHDSDLYPWAIFPYMNSIRHFLDDNTDPENWMIDNDFIKNMIKVRLEFGFLEQHPRHGRVCIEDSLEYAIQILDTVVIPIHFQFFDKEEIIRQKSVSAINMNYSYHHESNKNAVTSYDFHRMIQFYRQCLTTLQFEASVQTGGWMKEMLCILVTCIEELQLENLKFKPLPFVLCHCDIQPQNAIFCTRRDKSIKVPYVVSVLDWEEAAIADPRFEIMLICRKIVANQEQADFIWEYYYQALKARFKDLSDHLGPLKPWMKLEGVHSLISICLQLMDLDGGGRNPWETKRDLFQKSNRELERLKVLGWTFCSSINNL